jgi:hypothetical protein
MAPTIGPTTGPNTAPTPHIISAAGCRCGGKVASKTAWPIGMIGPPKKPWATRARISVSRLLASPHRNEDTVKPSTVKNIRLRQPSRLDSQPVIGVAIAVATRFSVITQEISSCVAEKVPRICGSTRLASVMVMPNSMFDSCTISTISHCRPLMLKNPPCAVAALIPVAFPRTFLGLCARFGKAISDHRPARG